MVQKKPLESKIQTDIIQYLRSRPNTFTYKHPPYPKGMPDIMHFEGGKAFAFEVKRTETDKPKPMQKLRKEQLREAGVNAYVVRSLAKVKKVLKSSIP